MNNLSETVIKSLSKIANAANRIVDFVGSSLDSSAPSACGFS